MRKLYFVLFLTVLCIFFFAILSYITPLGKKNTDEKVNPQASFYFSNSNLEPASNSARISTEIILDSNSPVSTAQVELSFNPLSVYNVSIYPAENNFFGDKNEYTVTLTEVRQEIGRVSFAIEQNASFSERQGVYPIAELQFQTSQNSGDYFKFLEKSSVLKRGKRESILTNTSALSSFKKTNTPSIQPNEFPQN